MGMNMIIYQIVNEYKKLDEVVAITLAGSGASGRKDNFSDIDIDIITNGEISLDKRKEIISKISDNMEIGNNFWGAGDEFVLRNSDVIVDLAYFDLNWLKDGLINVVDNYNASTGYTTCFWHNVIHSSIIYDKNREFEELQKKYNIPYPVELKKSIIEKNYPILRNVFSAYYNQIYKAIKRKDIVSINHRIAAYLASYFDIIFAINEIPHPGEKRLIAICNKICNKKPENFEKNLNDILRYSLDQGEIVLDIINDMVDQLDLVLKSEGLFIGINKEC